MHNIGRIPLRLGSRMLTKFFRQSKSRCMSNIKNPVNLKPISGSVPKGIFGQPTCYTHPHLISEGHLTCGISQQEYKDRRDGLVNNLTSVREHLYKTHIIIVPAACKQYMSDNIPYVFRQNSNFFYLTGCMEPGAVLVMVKYEANNDYESILFVNERDSRAELWEGPRTGCAAAARLFAVNEARPLDNFSTFINRLTVHSKPAVLWYQNESTVNPDTHAAVTYCLTQGNVSLEDPLTALHHMRVLKSPAEVALLREACHIGAQSVNTAMAVTRPGVSEHYISAVLEHSARLGGAQHAAFPPVVAGGARATHIHYVSNDQLLLDGEMLLVDSGCQRWLYNSDISRTWPVSGKFSAPHRVLYELVLSVQKRLIEVLGEQRPALDQLFNHMCLLLGEHLQEEGIFSKNMDANQLIANSYRVCPHHVSHYLGLDVHDAPLVRRRTPVLPGMLVTVEPGIYLRADDASVPPEFRGAGVRIEDDVLITDTGLEVLTSAAVKEVADVEALVGSQDTHVDVC